MSALYKDQQITGTVRQNGATVSAVNPDMRDSRNYFHQFANHVGNAAINNPTNAQDGDVFYVTFLQDGSGSRSVSRDTQYQLNGANINTGANEYTVCKCLVIGGLVYVFMNTSASVAGTHNRTIYVDANGGDDTTGMPWDINKPFKTILAAMSAVTIPGEEVVHVLAGNYDEADTINMTTHMECSANVNITKTGTFVSTMINNNGYDIIGYPHIEMNTGHFSAVWANGGRVEIGRVFGTPSSTSSRVILVNQEVLDPINIHIQEIDNGGFGNPIYRHTSAAKTQEVNIKIGRCKNGYGTLQNVFAMLGDSNIHHKIHCDFVESLGADMYEFTPTVGKVVEFSGTYSRGGGYAGGMSVFALNDMKVDSLWTCECNVMEINNVDSTDSLSPNPFVNGGGAITTVGCRTRNANLPSAALGITGGVFVTGDTNVQIY